MFKEKDIYNKRDILSKKDDLKNNHKTTKENKKKAELSFQQTKQIVSKIQSWEKDPKLEFMKISENYYNVINDITFHQRKSVGKNGQAQNATNVANTKLSHAFLRELVDQKVQYLLGKQASVVCEKHTQLLQQAQKVLNHKFFKTVKEATRNAIVSGIAWIHIYYNESGKLCFANIDPKEVIPIWKNSQKEVLEAVIRIYPTNKGSKEIQTVEYWSDQGVFVFHKTGENLVQQRQRSHFFCNTLPFNWNKVPFVPVRYNSQETPLLAFVKSLIDDYDLSSSNLSNALQDQPNSILVVKNYDGQKLDEFRKNLAVFRAVKVSGDGGVEAINTPVCHEATIAHLEQLRRDIYAFGRGVDTRNEHSIAGAGSVALKHVYARLDLDCNSIEGFLKVAIDEIIFFVCCDVFNSQTTNNVPDFFRTEKELSEQSTNQERIEIVFNRDIIVSEASAIEMCLKSKNIISDQTIIENHPWASDAFVEQERLEKQMINKVK